MVTAAAVGLRQSPRLTHAGAAVQAPSLPTTHPGPLPTRVLATLTPNGSGTPRPGHCNPRLRSPPAAPGWFWGWIKSWGWGGGENHGGLGHAQEVPLRLRVVLGPPRSPSPRGRWGLNGEGRGSVPPQRVYRGGWRWLAACWGRAILAQTPQNQLLWGPQNWLLPPAACPIPERGRDRRSCWSGCSRRTMPVQLRASCVSPLLLLLPGEDLGCWHTGRRESRRRGAGRSCAQGRSFIAITPPLALYHLLRRRMRVSPS